MATFKMTYAPVSSRAKTDMTLQLMTMAEGVRMDPLTTAAGANPVQAGGVDWTAPADGAITWRCDGDVVMDIGASADADATPKYDSYANERGYAAIAYGEGVSVKDG